MPPSEAGEQPMTDVIYVLLSIVCFVVFAYYAVALDKV